MKGRFRKNFYCDLICNHHQRHHHQEADDMNYLSIGGGDNKIHGRLFTQETLKTEHDLEK